MIILLDNIRSAMNVGSILRTAEGLGISEVILCGITPGLENEKIKKTSLGAEKNLDLRIIRSSNEAINYLKEQNINIYCLEITKESKNISTAKPEAPFALVVGNEVSGVSGEFLKEAKEVFFIPMQGKKESLNVSVAFGIAAFSILNNYQ